MSTSCSEHAYFPKGSTTASPSTARSGVRLPIALIVAALIIGVIELAVSRIPVYPATHLSVNRLYAPNKMPYLAESITQWQLYHALTSEENVDVVVVGDSSALLGVIPRLIEQKTGLSAWNIGTIGYYATPGYTYFMRLFIEQRGAPQYAVLNLTEKSLTRDNSPYRHWLMRVREWLAPVTEGALQEVTPASRSESWLPPSYGSRSYFQNLLFNFSGSDYPRWLAQTPFDEAPMITDGEVNEQLLANRGYLARYHADRPFDGSIVIAETPDAEALAGLEQFLALADEYNIKVLVIMTPLAENAHTLGTVATISAIETAVAERIQEHPNATRAPFQFVSSRLMASQYHMNEAGAEVQTERVVEWLTTQRVERD